MILSVMESFMGFSSGAVVLISEEPAVRMQALSRMHILLGLASILFLFLPDSTAHESADGAGLQALFPLLLLTHFFFLFCRSSI